MPAAGPLSVVLVHTAEHVADVRVWTCCGELSVAWNILLTGLGVGVVCN